MVVDESGERKRTEKDERGEGIVFKEKERKRGKRSSSLTFLLLNNQKRKITRMGGEKKRKNAFLSFLPGGKNGHDGNFDKV